MKAAVAIINQSINSGVHNQHLAGRFAANLFDKFAIRSKERGISFEEIVFHIGQEDIIDVLEHPNQNKYEGQRILVINVEGYAYLVPYLETGDEIILKTIIPSRKATRKYLKGE